MKNYCSKNYYYSYYSNAKFFIVLISLFIFSNCIYTIRASDCSPKNDCDPNQKYPFWVCDYSLKDNPTVLKCIPLSEIRDLYDAGQIPAAPFPICLKFDERIDAVYLKGGIRVFDTESAKKDLEIALNRWNCICSGQSGDCKCEIKVIFSKSSTIYNEMKELAMADLGILAGSSSCKISCKDTYIVINNSNYFMYGIPTPDKDAKPDQFFITDTYASNTTTMDSLSKNNCRVYNFTEIIMHELGHLFSFGHYDEGCGNKSNPNEIMNSTQRPTNGTSKELSDYEKCRFQALYCFSSIYEYEPHSSNLYPNPSHNEVVLEFELEASYDNVTIEVYNGLGNVLLTPVENKTYEFGLNRELINVSSLENGYYYVIINTSTKKYVKPFIVIK